MPSHEWPRLQLKKDPGKNFYLAVNDNWLETHKIPTWMGEYSISDEATNKTNKELLKILDSLSNLNEINLKPRTPKEHLQILGYLLKNKHKNFKSEEVYLQVCLHELIDFKDVKEIATFLGWMVRCSIPTIINFVVKRELDPPYHLRTTLIPGDFLLPLEYYLNPQLKKSDVWIAYEQFISICSIELGIPFLHKAIEAEESLVHKLSKPFTNLAKSKKGSEWKSWMPDFEWSSFMSGLDIDNEWERRIWTIDAVECFKAILDWICSTKEELIISLFSIHLIRTAAPYLRPAIKNAYNALYYKALLGITNKPSKEISILNQIKSILPDALCNIYSKHHHDFKTLNGITQLISSLQSSAIDYMMHSTLITKRTKTRIIEKLRRMKFIIGNSKTMPMPKITYNPDSIIHTLFSIKTAKSKASIMLAGKTIDKIHNNYACYITNASYFEDSNDIYIPWGILQFPFYSSKSNTPLGWNHGGIGATICHEITHAFDLQGSLFTSTGQFKETWTRKNRRKFKKQTRKVSEFFEKFKHFGKKINGKKTLSENWADLGGLKISMNSLNSELSKQGASNEERKEAHRNFFLSYAFSWNSLYKKKTLIYAMNQSVHSLSEDRVNRIVPQFQEWVDAFGIKETDLLYLAPEKRLKFF